MKIRKLIVLSASIILVVPFCLMLISALFGIGTGMNFEDTVLGGLIND